MDELNWESYPLAASVKVRVILFRECDNKVISRRIDHMEGNSYCHGGSKMYSRCRS